MHFNNSVYEWDEINLKDYIVTIESGKRPKGGAVSEGIPSLGGGHINSNGGFNIESSKLKYVPLDFYNKMKTGIIRSGDILVVKDGATTGKVAYVDDEFPLDKACINEHVYIIRANANIDSKFLSYYLRSDLGQKKILNDFRGATIGGISKEFVNFIIKLPPLETQKKIVEVLEKAEKALEKRKEANRLLDEYLKSVFVRMFGDPISNSKNWEKLKMRDVGDVFTGNTPSRKESKYYGDYIEWIKSDNINTPEHFLTKASEFLSVEGAKVGRVVPKDSILVTCIAGSKSCIGNVALTDRVVAFNQQINAVVPREVNPYYLYMYILVGKKLIQEKSTNSMKGMVNKSTFEEIEIMMPPLELQCKFENIFIHINFMKKKSCTLLNGLEDLFNALMMEAFNSGL